MEPTSQRIEGVIEYQWAAQNERLEDFSAIYEIFKTSVQNFPDFRLCGEIVPLQGEDQISEVLLCNKEPVSFIIYKNIKQRKRAREGVNADFVVKTLFVANSNHNRSSECHQQIIDKIFQLTGSQFALDARLVLAKEAGGLLDYFTSKGFKIKNTCDYGESSFHLLDYFPAISKSGPKKRRKDFHNLTMKKIFIEKIREGTKTIEVRPYQRAVVNYRVGDKLRFWYYCRPKDDVTCEITEIKTFPTFRELLTASNYSYCVPDCSSLDNAVEAYNQIPKYREKEQESGVVAIHVKPAS